MYGGFLMKIKEIVFVVEEDPEQRYIAKALGYSIFSEGNSLQELKDNIKDAIKGKIFLGLKYLEISMEKN